MSLGSTEGKWNTQQLNVLVNSHKTSLQKGGRALEFLDSSFYKQQKADLVSVINNDSIFKCQHVPSLSHSLVFLRPWIPFLFWGYIWTHAVFGAMLSNNISHFNSRLRFRDFSLFLEDEGWAVQGSAIWKDFKAPQEAGSALDRPHLPSQWQFHRPSKGKKHRNTCFSLMSQ